MRPASLLAKLSAAIDCKFSYLYVYVCLIVKHKNKCVKYGKKNEEENYEQRKLCD